jgi:hypothetical protein
MYSFRLYRPRKDGWVFWGTWSANGYQSAARICHYATGARRVRVAPDDALTAAYMGGPRVVNYDPSARKTKP